MGIKNDLLYLSGKKNRKQSIWGSKEIWEEINENSEAISREIRSETRIMQAFNELLSAVQSLKYEFNSSSMMGDAYGEDPETRLKRMIELKDKKKKLKEKLRKLCDEKMDQMHEVIKDILGEKEETDGEE